jgi:hypothetical protein
MLFPAPPTTPFMGLCRDLVSTVFSPLFSFLAQRTDSLAAQEGRGPISSPRERRTPMSRATWALFLTLAALTLQPKGGSS